MSISRLSKRPWLICLFLAVLAGGAWWLWFMPANRCEDALRPLLADGRKLLLLERKGEWGFFTVVSTNSLPEVAYGTLHVDRENVKEWKLRKVWKLGETV